MRRSPCPFRPCRLSGEGPQGLASSELARVRWSSLGKCGWLPAPWSVSSIQTAHCTFYGSKLRIYEARERQRETEGRAGQRGRADSTYNLCSGSKTLYKLWPPSLFPCPLCIPNQLAVFCREQGELGTHHPGACPRDEQLAGYGSGIQIWDLGDLCREQRKCFFDGQTPVLMGSYYSELCRRPGLWSTQELVENISKAPWDLG